jgi:hypothetical protein
LQHFLPGAWVGTFYGTDHGRVFLKFSHIDGTYVLEGRININGEISNLRGAKVSDETEPIPVTWTRFDDPRISTKGLVKLTSLEATRMQGEWETETGGQGVFECSRFVVPHPAQASIPEVDLELVASTAILGPSQLFKSELVSLAEKLLSLFSQQTRGRLVVSTDPGYKEYISRFWEDFFKKGDLPRRVDNLKLQLSDTSTEIHKLATVEFLKDGSTSILVQSGDRTWTHGAREALESHLRKHTSNLRRWLLNDYLNINTFLFVFSLIFLPDMSMSQRIVYMVVVIGLLLGSNALRFRLRANSVWLDDTKRSAFVAQRTNVAVTLLGVVIGGAIAMAAALVQVLWLPPVQP